MESFLFLLTASGKTPASHHWLKKNLVDFDPTLNHNHTQQKNTNNMFNDPRC